jgi:hypothetical protein
VHFSTAILSKTEHYSTAADNAESEELLEDAPAPERPSEPQSSA